jgi:predicted transcriptional regulator
MNGFLHRKPVEVLPAELPLHELRQARGLSQQALASRMNVQQPIVAKQEHQRNMCISTLRSHIEAMGGTLEIVAHFPEGNVKISNF